MFTKEQAIELLEKSWMIDNVEIQLENNRKKLLNKIIVTIEERVPFNFLYARLGIISPITLEHSLEEIEKHCVSGNGGTCAVISLFANSLLKGLGYSSYICLSTVTSTQVDPHVLLIIKDLEKEGDLHLVDCGSGLPYFQAISLNFDYESPVYKESFLEHKLIRHDGKYLLMHGEGDLVNRTKTMPHLEFSVGKWRRFYFFTPREMIEVNSVGDLFTGPYANVPRFHYNCKDLPRRAARFSGGKAVIISENRLLLENRDKGLEEIAMDTKDEIFKAYRKYFPMIDEHVVHQAYADWGQPSSKL